MPILNPANDNILKSSKFSPAPFVMRAFTNKVASTGLCLPHLTVPLAVKESIIC